MFRPNTILLAFACSGCMFAGTVGAEDLLRLWGIDADDAQLFAIDDLDNPQSTFNDFGPVHVADGFTARPVTGDIRALTIVNTFDAYVVVNESIGEYAGPVLLHVDLEDIALGVPVVADVIGSIGAAGWDQDWTVTGIAGDPLYNVMYLLSADGDMNTDDRITRVYTDAKRRIRIEPLGKISWKYGGVRMGSDITLGPAGLLLVADEAEGRVVMVDPETGTVRGVRLEGIRVDTDTAQYAGIAWDGYNNRTAMFDRRTGQLIIDDRTSNSISAFDLTSAGVVDAEGLEFVFRPTPPGEGATSGSSAMRGVSNIARRQRYGSSRGTSSGGGRGGGGSSPLDFADLIEDQSADDLPEDLPEDPFDDPSDDSADNPLDDFPDDDPPDDDSDDHTVVPVPGAGVILGLGLGFGVRRRRR